MGTWPLRTALANGEGLEYESALYRIMEAGMIAQYESIRQGCNYSRPNVLINFDGWTVEEGGVSCLECMLKTDFYSGLSHSNAKL